MLSYLIFCHKKDNSDSYSLIGKEEGFFNTPAFISDILLGGNEEYEGSCLINDSDLLSNTDKGSVIQVKSNEVSLLKSVATKIKNAGKVGVILDKYKEERHLSLAQEILVQKVILSVFQEAEEETPYLFIDLSQTEEAPLLLDALGYFYPKEDVLLCLPKNLRFAFAVFGQEQEPQAKVAPIEPLTDQEGYHNFFDDLVGIKSLDADTPTRIQASKKKEEIVEEYRQEKALPSKPQRTKKVSKKQDNSKKETGIAKKDVNPLDFKNANWNLFFFYLFSLLEFSVPVLFYLFLLETASVYFVIYILFEIFFLVMATLSICFIREGKNKLTKKHIGIVTYSSPFIPLLGVLIFVFLSKLNGWTGYPFWTFVGIGISGILIYAPFIWAFERIYIPHRAKKKGGKKK